MWNGRRVSLVLGGGGMLGLAHLGVLRALRRLEIEPDECIGTSAGSLVCALLAGGMSVEGMISAALSIRRETLLDPQWIRFLTGGSGPPSLYRGRRLHDWVKRLLPRDRFRDLLKPLCVSTTDLVRGESAVWDGASDVPVHDCVVASCSLPGIFPPVRIGSGWYADGGILDVLPVGVAVARGADMILGVYLDSFDASESPLSGIGASLWRAHSIVTRSRMRDCVQRFPGAPIHLIQPSLAGLNLMKWDSLDSVIEAGERAAMESLPRIFG